MNSLVTIFSIIFIYLLSGILNFLSSLWVSCKLDAWFQSLIKFLGFFFIFFLASIPCGCCWVIHSTCKEEIHNVRLICFQDWGSDQYISPLNLHLSAVNISKWTLTWYFINRSMCYCLTSIVLLALISIDDPSFLNELFHSWYLWWFSNSILSGILL